MVDEVVDDRVDTLADGQSKLPVLDQAPEIGEIGAGFVPTRTCGAQRVRCAVVA